MAIELRKSSTYDLTAFVREVVLPGSNGAEPVLDAERCYFRLEYRHSPIHRWGIFAAEAIPARRRVIEYTGQKISEKEVWRRRFREHIYIFWVNDKRAIDGALGGSGAEYINHSCEPNLISRVAGSRIFLTSIRKITAGEELTYDYNLDDEERPIACTCGAASCKGVITHGDL